MSHKKHYMQLKVNHLALKLDQYENYSRLLKPF